MVMELDMAAKESTVAHIIHIIKRKAVSLKCNGILLLTPQTMMYVPANACMYLDRVCLPVHILRDIVCLIV